MKTLTRARYWVWGGVITAVASVPLIVAALTAPDGMRFLGMLISPDDTSVYLAAMRQGSAGRWLYAYQFSPEPLAPQLSYLPYLLTGNLLGANLAAFHLLRLVGNGLLLWAIWFWVRGVFRENGRVQTTAWLLTVLGGGLGWLAVLFAPERLVDLPDLTLAEWGVLLPLVGMPHFSLGLAWQVLLMGCLVRMAAGVEGRLVALAAACGVLLALTYPFNLVVAGGTVGLVLLGWLVGGRQRWRTAVAAFVILLPMGAAAAYYGLWATRDPLWERLQVQGNQVPAPGVAALLIGLGLVGGLAVLGLRRGWINGRGRVAVVWTAVNLAALVLPVPFAGRFVLGLTVPVATLAAFGLEAVVVPRFGAARQATARRVFLILLLPSLLMAWSVLLLSPAARPDFPLYLPEAEWRAAQWLGAQQTAADVTLVQYPVGNVLPRVSDGRVFVGQPFLTVDLDEKLVLVNTFWDANTSDAWREAFVAEWAITHVVVGAYERGIMRGNVIPPGELIYDEAGVQIYAVGQ